MARSIIIFSGCFWFMAILGCGSKGANQTNFIIPEGFRGWVIMELMNSSEDRVRSSAAAGFVIPKSGRIIAFKDELSMKLDSRYYIMDSRGVMVGVDQYASLGIHGAKDISIGNDSGNKRYYVFFVGSETEYEGAHSIERDLDGGGSK